MDRSQIARHFRLLPKIELHEFPTDLSVLRVNASFEDLCARNPGLKSIIHEVITATSNEIHYDTASDLGEIVEVSNNQLRSYLARASMRAIVATADAIGLELSLRQDEIHIENALNEPYTLDQPRLFDITDFC